MEKVLIVDDTKNIRVLLKTCLELRNYKVISVENGKAALQILSKEGENIDLVFLDIRMPEMNGTDVLRLIREMGILCPIIIMTAYATVKNAIDCTKLGAVAYLQKPFSPERINSVLDEVFVLKTNIQDSTKNIFEQKTYVEKARALISKGNYSKAYDSLKLALSKDPYDSEIYYLLGQLNEGINNMKEAKRFYAIAELFNSEDD